MNKAISHSPQNQRPRYSGDELRAALSVYDRRPFIDLLTEWINSAPAPADVAAFATKAPDKYIASLSGLARIAGFTEKTETLIDINVNYRALSDSQLEDRLSKLTAELANPNAERDEASLRDEDPIVESTKGDIIDSTIVEDAEIVEDQSDDQPDR